MSEFEDANVDKDLLSQIFGDSMPAEKDGEAAEGDLFADSAADGQSAETDAAEELSVEDILNAAKEAPEPSGTVQDVEDAAKKEIEEKAVDTPEQSDEDMLSVEDILNAAKEEPEPARQEAGTETPQNISVAKSSEKTPAAQMDDDVTWITKGTTINGGISSEGSLEIMGTITGDVDCLGRVSVYGTISGNVSAENVLVDTNRLEGNIKSEGSVEVAKGTVIIGDIEGTSASVAGAVKGNIDVNGPVVIDSTAVVQGSIKAKSIQVNTGAVVDGYCSLNYAGVKLDDFFEEK